MTALGAPVKALGASATALGAAVLAAPVVVVVASLVEPSTDTWSHLWQTRLVEMLVSTAVLAVGVVAASLVVGTAAAWLVAAHDFPGRRLLGWLLALPLALPGYVSGFTWLDVTGRQGLVMAAVVLTASLYPYVYLLTLAAFREQSARTVEAARTLGCSRWRAWWRVVLPLARPSLAAGAALVAMEVLTDVGTVRLFDVTTVADGVFRVWFGLDDRDGAAELASVLVGAAVVMVTVERLARGRARFVQRGGRDTGVAARRVRGARGIAVAAGPVVLLLVALGVPLVRLVPWAWTTVAEGQGRTVSGGAVDHLLDSLLVVSLAVVVTVVAGTALALAGRPGRARAARVLARVATTGYAVPGPVVAIGVLVCVAWLEAQGWWPAGWALAGTLGVLVYALAVRYVAVAHAAVAASADKVPERVVEAARTLGSGPGAVALRVELPLVRPGVVVAAALVGIDVVKELPVTLLLRPFGVDTLPVWVWQATSDSRWEQAAVPGLLVAGLASVGVAVLLAALARGAEMVA